MNHDLVAARAAGETIELLMLCWQLQPDKDGRERPAPGAYSCDKYEFADRICSVCRHALQLRRLLSVTTTLSTIGTGWNTGEKSLCSREKITRRRLWIGSQSNI